MMGALPGVRRLSRTSSSLEKREHCQPWLLSHSYFPYFFTFFFFFFFFFSHFFIYFLDNSSIRIQPHIYIKEKRATSSDTPTQCSVPVGTCTP